jgi:hypothetical protein
LRRCPSSRIDLHELDASCAPPLILDPRRSTQGISIQPRTLLTPALIPRPNSMTNETMISLTFSGIRWPILFS